MNFNLRDVEDYGVCECGAVSITIFDDRTYHCRKENIPTFFNFDFGDLEQNCIENGGEIHRLEYYCCDHCVNHYGLDLCGCGSGEDYGNCNYDFDECSYPMEDFGRAVIRGMEALI